MCTTSAQEPVEAGCSTRSDNHGADVCVCEVSFEGNRGQLRHITPGRFTVLGSKAGSSCPLLPL